MTKNDSLKFGLKLEATTHPTIDDERFRMMQACLASQVDKVPGHGSFYASFGPPGIGKSWESVAFAKFHNLYHVAYVLCANPSPDVVGFYVPKLDTNEVIHIINKSLTDPEYDRDKYVGVLITFEEISSALMDQQVVIQCILNEWQNQGHAVNENVFFSFAGNRQEDNCGAGPISQALQDRMLIQEMEISVPGWMTWAGLNDIDLRVMQFISFKNERLHQFDPQARLGGQCTPRSWEKASHMMQVMNADDKYASEIVAAKCGAEVGVEFSGFLRLASDLPTVAEILADPEGASLPHHNNSAVYAVGVSLAYEYGQRKKNGLDVTEAEVNATITYLRRMQEGMAVFAFRMIEKISEDFCNRSVEFTKFKQDYKHISI